MALIITSEIATDGGVTSEAYLNIQKVSFTKDKAIDVWVNLYLSQNSREENPGSTVKSNQVYSRFGMGNTGSPSALELLGHETLYEVAYSEIKSILESKGLTVEDTI